MGSILISCSDDPDETMEEIMNPFTGNWTGTLSGQLDGTVRMTVSADDKMGVIVTFPNGLISRSAGTVSITGDIEGSGTSPDGDVVTFTGRFQSSNGTGSWNVSNDSTGANFSGSWNVTKDN